MGSNPHTARRYAALMSILSLLAAAACACIAAPARASKVAGNAAYDTRSGEAQQPAAHADRAAHHTAQAGKAAHHTAQAGKAAPHTAHPGKAAHHTAQAGKAKRKDRKKSGNGERGVEASIFVKFGPPSEQLPQTGTINLFVPKRFRDAGAKLPHCTTDQLAGKGPRGCPTSTIVGSGTSIGYTILGGQFVRENLTLTIFNGPKASLLTWVEGRTPVAIEEIVYGVITKPSGFGQELSFTIPHGLLEPLPGAPGWLATLNAHLSGKAGWLRSTSCPPHPWSLKAEFGYTPLHGSEALGSVEVESTLSCV